MQGKMKTETETETETEKVEEERERKGEREGEREREGCLGRRLSIAVVGAGLVGSLSACYLARQGHSVVVYDYREDVRKVEAVGGRSVNLAVSARGRAALSKVGLESAVIEGHGLPLSGRMIHRLKGSNYSIPYDAVKSQCIYSANRKYLNELLVSAAEAHPTVKVCFKSKLVSLNVAEGSMNLLRMETGEIVKVAADLIIGADGAHSTVRKELLKQPLFNYSQEYVEHGYKELHIPPGKNGEFLMDPNYLHIWPRTKFMMIALPNQDRSWTVTLFMPFSLFRAISTPETLLHFFRNNFPDALQLISETSLINDYFSTTPSYLISVKCKPFHMGSKVLLIGDAAHAMVPFFGQGMNAVSIQALIRYLYLVAAVQQSGGSAGGQGGICLLVGGEEWREDVKERNCWQGFEDCVLLDRLMREYMNRLEIVLPKFSEIRCPDAEAICDLAMYNYIEMRDLVNKRSFLVRKHVDNFLYRLLSKHWLPLYNSVTFTDMNYSQCIENKKFQDKVIWSAFLMLIGAIILMILHFQTTFLNK